MEVRFAWDPAKAAANKRKHRISFETAREIFDDPFHIVIDSALFEDGEQRYQAIGMSAKAALLVVAFVDRSDAHAITLRLISARKVTEYEKNIYYDAQA